MQVDLEEAKTAGGLFLGPIDPDVGKKPTHGIVRAVGPGRMNPEGELVPNMLQVGDHIKFRDFAGSEITMDFARTTVYRVMREEEVLVRW
jgi:chaperonin GroES